MDSAINEAKKTWPKVLSMVPHFHDGEKQLYRLEKNVVVRHRMSKELALELLEEYGTGAYLFVVEKLANNSANAGMWRDVLTWLDELRGEKKCLD